MHIEVEQGARLSPRLCQDEVIEADVVGQHQVLLDVHHVADGGHPAAVRQGVRAWPDHSADRVHFASRQYCMTAGGCLISSCAQAQPCRTGAGEQSIQGCQIPQRSDLIACTMLTWSACQAYRRQGSAQSRVATTGLNTSAHRSHHPAAIAGAGAGQPVACCHRGTALQRVALQEMH